MNKFRLLTQTLMKNQEMSKPKDKRDSRAYTVFGGAALLFIMIPCCLIVGFLAYIMTVAISEAGGGYEGILFIVHFMSACSVVFGLNVIIDTFYFSSDIDYLLPLPLKITEIIGAKFFQAYVSESVMEFMILFSGLVGFIIGSGFGVVGSVAAIIGVVTLPIIPLTYCGIMSLIIMYVTRGIKNKKTLEVIVGILVVLMIGGIVWSFGGISGLTIENYVGSLAGGQNIFINSMNILFFHDRLLVIAVGDNSILAIVIYILATMAAVLLFLAMAGFMYLPGLYKIRSASYSRGITSIDKLKSRCKPRNPEISYFIKEVKILIRTNAYFTNCIGINLLWPIALLVCALLKGKSPSIVRFIDIYHEGRVASDLIVLLIFLILSVLITAANSLASSAFTREGAHFEFMKYIPLSYKKQIEIKALISILFSYSSVLMCDGILIYYLKMGLLESVYMLVITFFGVVFITYLGIILDSIHPKLMWDDELGALRGNLNVFFNMAFAMIAGCLLCIVAVGLYLISAFGSFEIYIVFIVIVILVAVTTYRISMIRSVRNVIKLLD